MQKLLYKELKQELGMSDAINEFIEVLLRQFENSSYDDNSFQNIATEFGIKVNNVTPQEALCKIREYYIISTFKIFEEQLNKLHCFLKKYGKYKSEIEPSDSMLKHLYKNLIGMSKTSEISYLYYLVCDYYRLVRNYCAHADNLDKIRNLYETLDERKEEIMYSFGQLQAPNEYGSINFDDFILYSRAAKKLMEIYINNIVYDIDKLVENFDMKRFRKYRNNPERLQKAIENELKSQLTINPEIVKNVVDKLIEKV